MVLLNNDRLQFGSTAPTFTVFNTTDRSGRTRESTIVSREISTVNVTYSSFLTQLSYTIITATSPDCLITGMFMFTLPQLQYRRGNSPWMNMETGEIMNLKPIINEELLYNNIIICNINDIQLINISVMLYA